MIKSIAGLIISVIGLILCCWIIYVVTTKKIFNAVLTIWLQITCGCDLLYLLVAAILFCIAIYGNIGHVCFLRVFVLNFAYTLSLSIRGALSIIVIFILQFPHIRILDNLVSYYCLMPSILFSTFTLNVPYLLTFHNRDTMNSLRCVPYNETNQQVQLIAFTTYSSIDIVLISCSVYLIIYFFQTFRPATISVISILDIENKIVRDAYELSRNMIFWFISINIVWAVLNIPKLCYMFQVIFLDKNKEIEEKVTGPVVLLSSVLDRLISVTILPPLRNEFMYLVCRRQIE